MKKILNLLILEDNPADAELAVKELEKEGFVIEWSLVETEEAFREALNQKPEVILADYSLPSFDGLSALKIKQEISPTIPLIIISGTIGEEFATECIKTGATDYVLKDKLFRLVPVIKRALKEAEEHRERKQAEELFKKLFINSPNAIFVIQDGEFKLVNPQFTKETGCSQKEALSSDPFKFIHPEDKEKVRENVIKKLKRGLSSPFEYRGIRKDGEVRWVLETVTSVTYQGKRAMLGNFKDVTDIKHAEKELQQSYKKLQKTMEGTINVIVNIVEAKDPYTAGHQMNVSKLATAIAKEIELSPSPDRIEGIRIASLVHDIGKISLPAEILSKPSKLDEIEYSLIKGHSKMGFDILKSIEFPWPVAQITLQHHERIDGSGYPQGLKGNDILLEARIMAVADVVEAMSSHRPYRPALGIDKALEEISQNKGILYDSKVVDICLKLFRKKSFKFES
ncbi:MAG: PAS domain S-box protein [Candidatus Atribacteria bacterium]|nr:PAS domain S-box protein [Candidatus Atribacteria bacterium]